MYTVNTIILNFFYNLPINIFYDKTFLSETFIIYI